MHRLFVDNLTVIDFAFLDPDRGLVGESWIVDVELAGELDHQGMVFDFSLVKKRIKRLIDEQADHRLLVPQDFSGLTVQQHNDQGSALTWRTRQGDKIEHRSPADSVLFTPGSQLDEASLARQLEQALASVLPANVDAVSLTLRPEVIQGPWYHYVHGLKKHDGNCQRIAHGHRSRLLIERNGVRADDLEQQWADRFQDIYIATREDLLEQFHEDGCQYHHYGYHSDQGEFALTIAAHRVHLIDTDSTVEWIADHLLKQCQNADPGAQFRVRAFEGVGKGALADSA
ncbi:MAG: 6-pyruvoyl tetrahydropterin reductase [Halomonadaceae bacterium]|nr:MAG: 6-pyruvoyl tetrahydropterin reductase [Halomonadaceae bacterium]